MLDSILWVTGVLTWLVVIYYFVLRHILAGLTAACRVCWWLVRVDFSDEERVNQQVSRHYSHWDKLWMVPEVFVNRFITGVKNSMDWG